MEDRIKKILGRCCNCDLSYYDEVAHVYHIPRYTKPQFNVGQCYLVRVSGAIVKNPGSLAAVNWNNGAAPQFEGLKIYVSKKLGKMLYCDCAGYDLDAKREINYVWSGWLGVDDLEQLAAL